MEKGREIYVCITYYHVLISLMKSVKYPGENDLVLCGEPRDTLLVRDVLFQERLKGTGIFRRIILCDYSRYSYTQEALPGRLKNYIAWKWVLRTSDMDWVRGYDEVFVFNDTTSFAKCLIHNKTPYVLLEDGQDCYLKYKPDLKKAICNTFLRLIGLSSHATISSTMATSKYIKYVAVNKAEGVLIKGKEIVEAPKEQLFQSLTKVEKEQIARVFINADLRQIQKKSILILTQPLKEDGVVRTEEEQAAIYRKIIEEYSSQGEQVVIKPHPRDICEYRVWFREALVMEAAFPIEVLILVEGIKIKKAITLYSTAIEALEFIDEKDRIVLGREWVERILNKTIFSGGGLLE